MAWTAPRTWQPGDIVTAAQLNEQVRDNLLDLRMQMPVGVVLPFAGTTAPPGWALCEGQAVSRTTHAALFAAVGVTYGAGDGVTTFDLPDLRGRVPVGASGTDIAGDAPRSARALGASGGAEEVVLTTDQIPVNRPIQGSSGIPSLHSSGSSSDTRPPDPVGLMQP